MWGWLFCTTSHSCWKSCKILRTYKNGLLGIVYLFKVHTFSRQNVMLNKMLCKTQPSLFDVHGLSFLSLKCSCNQVNPSIYSDEPKLISYPHLMFFQFGLRFSSGWASWALVLMFFFSFLRLSYLCSSIFIFIRQNVSIINPPTDTECYSMQLKGSDLYFY